MKTFHKIMLTMATGALALSGSAVFANEYENNNNKRSSMQSDNQQYYQLGMEDIKDVQESLDDKGYNLEVDGIWGARTDAAIRRFQRDNNIRATGDLDSRTLSALDVKVDNSRDWF